MSASAYIFIGPTLPLALLQEKFGLQGGELVLGNGAKIIFLPPVSEGDIMKLVPLEPAIIGIIDGYFETVPSVRHKEILWAMAQGIHVLGASSMGALRAAELEAFGVEGVGAVFRAFADGFLEDDDEVTVVHGAQELGYPLLSEAMVNIRRTLDDAAAAGILSPSERDAALAIAKGLHYKSRTYGRVLSLAKEQGLGLERFAAWLPGGRKDQKLADAVELVETVVSRMKGTVAPKQISYDFENTLPWQRARTKDI